VPTNRWQLNPSYCYNTWTTSKAPELSKTLIAYKVDQPVFAVSMQFAFCC